MLIIKQRVWLWLASNAPISTVHWLGCWPLLQLLVLHVATSGGSSNFKTGGWGRILGIMELFWCPFTHTLCFCVKGRDKIHTVNIVCWKQLMYMSVIDLKFAKTNSEQISNGCVPGAPVLDPPLATSADGNRFALLKFPSNDIYHTPCFYSFSNAS